MRAPAVLLLLLATACPPPTSLLGADGDRAGEFGDDGGFGALLFERAYRVRGDRALDVDVVVPADADGDVAGGSFAPVLLVQGGLVAVERYHWLAAHLASRGAVVVAPHHVFDLAFFSQGDGGDALAVVRASGEFGGVIDDRPALAVGHSLGGVVASNAFFKDDGGVSHLALLAAVPNPSLDLSRTSGRVLAVAGGSDGSIGPDEVKAGLDGVRSEKTFAVVDGLTHYALTDDPSDGERDKDGESDLDVGEARRRALVLVDALLASQQGDPAGDRFLDDPLRWPRGVHE